MCKFHRYHRSVYDHRRSETRAKSQIQHHSTLITSKSLHGGVIHDLDWDPKRPFKVKVDPPMPKVLRFSAWTIVGYTSRVSDRDCVVIPIFCEFLDSRNHLARSKR